MVSYHQSLARMVLQPAPNSVGAPAGSVFLQSFVLSDGTPCLKATLGWEGSESAPVIAVYAKPELDWNSEAGRIAAAWKAGPPATGELVSAPVVEKLSAEPATAKLAATAG
jgi:hypothetical protein